MIDDLLRYNADDKRQVRKSKTSAANLLVKPLPLLPHVCPPLSAHHQAETKYRHEQNSGRYLLEPIVSPLRWNDKRTRKRSGNKAIAAFWYIILQLWQRSFHRLAHRCSASSSRIIPRSAGSSSKFRKNAFRHFYIAPAENRGASHMFTSVHALFRNFLKFCTLMSIVMPDEEMFS